MIPLLVILVPLAAAIAMAIGGIPRRVRLGLLPLAPVPALAYAIFGDPGRTAVAEWLLLESHFGLVYAGPVFLFFTAALWTIAGGYAVFSRRERDARRFCFFWLLTLSGNIGLVLAGDVPSFYTSFALMTFSAYGLVVAAGSADAWRAGRIYIAMAVAGEAMLIGAFLLAVGAADSFMLADAAAAVAVSPHRNTIVLLALAGFGIKAGVFPLHIWLPLAHPVAPSPASAVLSGAMIKAGVVGWLHLLPGGYDAFPGWSLVMIALGLVTAFYGVVCGLGQRDLKTVLAYSSVSQMGILLLVVGAGLAEPDAWPAALIVVAVYSLNHAFSKGALFLGAGICGTASGTSVSNRRLILLGLALPALAIAGAPLMGGAIAKEAVKAATEVPSEAAPWLRVLLPLSAVATTVLLGRFLLLARQKMIGDGDRQEWLTGEKPGGAGKTTGLWAMWMVSLAASVFAVYFAIPWYALELRTAEATWYGLWESLWPILAGAAILGAVRFLPRSMRKPIRLPSGDLLVLVEWFVRKTRPGASWIIGAERWRIDFSPTIDRFARGRVVNVVIGQGEGFLRRRQTAGVFMMLFVLILWFLLR